MYISPRVVSARDDARNGTEKTLCADTAPMPSKRTPRIYTYSALRIHGSRQKDLRFARSYAIIC